MTAPLDHFEAGLLTELRAHVAERALIPADHQGKATAPSERRSWPRLLPAGVGVVLAAAGAVVYLPGLGATPAYSVSEGNSGTIEVQVNRFEDAPGLETELAEYGVVADITYVPDGGQCAPGRYVPIDNAGGISLSLGTDVFRIVLDPGTVQDGQTLVVDASLVKLADSIDSNSGLRNTGGIGVYVNAEIAQGPIEACVPIPRTN